MLSRAHDGASPVACSRLDEAARDRFLGRADPAFAPQRLADGAHAWRHHWSDARPGHGAVVQSRAPPYRSFSLAFVLVAANHVKLRWPLPEPSFAGSPEWTLELARQQRRRVGRTCSSHRTTCAWRSAYSPCSSIRTTLCGLRQPPGAQCARTFLALEACVLRRPADFAGPRPGGRQFSTASDATAGASLLARARSRRRPGGPQRAPDVYSAEPDDRVRGRSPGRRGRLDAAAGRCVPDSCRSDRRGRSDLADHGSTGGVGRIRGPLAEQVTCVPGEPAHLPPLVPTLTIDSTPSRWSGQTGCCSTMGRAGSLRMDRNTSFVCPRSVDTCALGERRCQSALRVRRVRVGRRLHLGREQRRKPIDALAQRSGDRRAWRGALSARRRDGRRVVADALACSEPRAATKSATAPATPSFTHRSHGLDQLLRVFVPPDDPVKIFS